jgi:hypothetical protein
MLLTPTSLVSISSTHSLIIDDVLLTLLSGDLYSLLWYRTSPYDWQVKSALIPLVPE